MHPKPPILTHLTMFPFAPPNAASEQLSDLMQEIRQMLGNPVVPGGEPSTAAGMTDAEEAKEVAERQSAREIERLQRVIETLKQELGKWTAQSRADQNVNRTTDEAQLQSKAHAAQVQELFERFAEEQRATIAATLKTRVDAMDEENELIGQKAQELEEERLKFTEAAVQLGRERAALEVHLSSCSVDYADCP